MERASSTQSSSTQQVSDLSISLVIGLISLFVPWYLSFLWRRRHLYLSSIQLQGPFAFPIIGSALSFIGNGIDATEKLSHMWNIYPGIFRIWFGTRMAYSLSDPKYLEILLTSPRALEKARDYRLLQPVFGSGLITAPASKWKRSRKIIHPTFNQKMLNTFLDIFVEHSKIFVEVMQSKSTGREEIDMFTSMSKLTFDSITGTAMGLQLNAQTSDSDVPRWIERISEIGTQRISNIFYHSDFIFDHSALGKEADNLKSKLKSLARKVIADKRSLYDENTLEYVDTDSSKIKPFLDLLLEMKDKNSCFSDDELLEETLTFLLAGTDTSAFTECATLTMLGMHQDVQERVLAEVLEVMGLDRDVNLSDLPKLQYMERVVKETLRLFPAVPLIARDVDENIDLGDHVIQKGTTVVIAISKVQRDEKYWPNALKFDPDRFLPEEMAKRPSGCYIPFSYGPRDCIGSKYAMMSIKVLLATILRRFRIYTSYKRVEDIKLKTHIVARLKDGFKISLEVRK